jgi:hypothetical protein
MGIGDPADAIATIENSRNPSQAVHLLYLRDENAFVTFGIQEHFAEMELMIPAYIAIRDFQLMGSIVSAILERLSDAKDRNSIFVYEPRFRVMDVTYSLSQYKGFMLLEPLGGSMDKLMMENDVPIIGGLN